MELTEGAPAPDFSLPVDETTAICLSDLRGAPVVLYFYPKDLTSGCTAEACAFRDNMGELAARGVTVLGVSPDGPASHKRFTDKFGLTFPLLSDADHAVTEAYGAWVRKSMYGRSYMGVERSTFIIDADGIITRIFRKVKVGGHVEEVIAALPR